MAEEGNSNVKHLGSFNKQFAKVQEYLMKALKKISKTSPYKKESLFFENQYECANKATSTNELIEVVNISLEMVLDLRE